MSINGPTYHKAVVHAHHQDILNNSAKAPPRPHNFLIASYMFHKTKYENLLKKQEFLRLGQQLISLGRHHPKQNFIEQFNSILQIAAIMHVCFNTPAHKCIGAIAKTLPSTVQESLHKTCQNLRTRMKEERDGQAKKQNVTEKLPPIKRLKTLILSVVQRAK